MNAKDCGEATSLIESHRLQKNSSRGWTDGGHSHTFSIYSPTPPHTHVDEKVAVPIRPSLFLNCGPCEALICAVITRAAEAFHLKSAVQLRPSGDEREAPLAVGKSGRTSDRVGVGLQVNLRQLKMGPLLHSNVLRKRHTTHTAGVRFVQPETGTEVTPNRLSAEPELVSNHRLLLSVNSN